MYELLNRNMIDGMWLENVEDNDNMRQIIFNKGKVGSIKIFKDKESEIKMRVSVYDNTTEFDIQDTNRIYSFIFFI